MPELHKIAAGLDDLCFPWVLLDAHLPSFFHIVRGLDMRHLERVSQARAGGKGLPHSASALGEPVSAGGGGEDCSMDDWVVVSPQQQQQQQQQSSLQELSLIHI